MRSDRELLDIINKTVREYCDTRTCACCALKLLCDYCDYDTNVNAVLPDCIKKLIEENENEN